MASLFQGWRQKVALNLAYENDLSLSACLFLSLLSCSIGCSKTNGSETLIKWEVSLGLGRMLTLAGSGVGPGKRARI